MYFHSPVEASSAGQPARQHRQRRFLFIRAASVWPCPKRATKAPPSASGIYPLSDGEGDDYQELIILDGYTLRTLERRWQVNENDGVWKRLEFDLSDYLGQTIYVYFNARNFGGGGSIAMYLDDVSVKICPVDAPAPIVTPTATSTPTIAPADDYAHGHRRCDFDRAG